MYVKLRTDRCLEKMLACYLVACSILLNVSNMRRHPFYYPMRKGQIMLNGLLAAKLGATMPHQISLF